MFTVLTMKKQLLFGRILMVLNLIMTMLDALGPTILQNPTQIIAFASNVIDSHLMQENHHSKQSTSKDKVDAGMAGIANLVPQDDEAPTYNDNEEDEASLMEEELSTLFLAINLLGAVLNGMCYKRVAAGIVLR
jgi:hypothetical protein